MKKNVIKLNESALRKIVAESVKRVLKEFNGDVSPNALAADIGFTPCNSSDDYSWITPDQLQGYNNYVISLNVNGQWLRSGLLHIDEEQVFEYAEKVTDRLQDGGWQPSGSGNGMMDDDEDEPTIGMSMGYEDIGYIDVIFEEDGSIGSDTCGSFVVDKNGFAFWND